MQQPTTTATKMKPSDKIEQVGNHSKIFTTQKLRNKFHRFRIQRRAKVWDEKKYIELEPNRYFWIAIFALFLLECLFLYLFYYFQGDNILLRIFFFDKYGEYFVLLIPVWIITLYNLKK